jgi:GTP-binding protein LepA
MNISNIRNFSIIAHIDHGKSTLADRMLEITGTVEARKMRDQYLDSMDLERERGITIKMQPVRMKYKSGDGEYELNLIDTPGHIDFSYEVSRALKAVEGTVLLVDSTQGVQAQTLSTLEKAKEAGLVIVPAVSKVDSPLARVAEVKREVATLLGVDESTILEVSGRTGQGVEALLAELVRRVPPPQSLVSAGKFQALVFDFAYSNHTGVILYVRVFGGQASRKDKLFLKAANERFIPIEIGYFAPERIASESLTAGEIGYVITGIKKPGIATVGDTVTLDNDIAGALAGYERPRPVVWASIYPESQDDWDTLRQALGRLRLSDSAFAYEEESSGLLGRGFRSGFLGMLHLEIITERLRREFNLRLVVTTPSITYEVETKRGERKVVYSAVHFPEYGDIARVFEPWVKATIISPSDYLGAIMQILHDHEAEVGETENFGDHRISVHVHMPLRELMRNFFDELKSASSGYASLSYEIENLREADVVKLDVLVADESVPAFARVVSRRRVEEEAERTVDKLFGILPKQMFTTKIQASALGRIISSRTLSAMRKDVTGYLYGGDITRKRKLWEKQKKGKKKMKERGVVNIPEEVFLAMVKRD